MTEVTRLAEFPANAQESAFTALVRQHVGMVYATARRQLGDAGLAEEVTQNVFIALARRYGSLRGSPTISGWLYKTALLEARQALRSELRRQRRETIAVELGVTAAAGESPWAALMPMLDEALMKLREGDRLAVLLRFFEDRPFREVGGALGISEDAAQKRVAKSLDELTRFFQRRGYQVSCAGASGAALFAQAVTAVPAPVLLNVTRAALAASGGASVPGLGLVVSHILHGTKLPLAVACACLAAIPVAYEAYALRRARRDVSAFTAQLGSRRQALDDARTGRDQLASRIRAVNASLAGLAARAEAGRRIAPTLPAWVDGSPFARVPKELLERIHLNAWNRDWRLRSELAELLALTPEQFDGTQRAVDDLFTALRALEEAHLQTLPPAPEDGGFGQRVVFRIARYEPEANAVRLQLRDRLRAALGEKRAELALRYMDLEPARRGMPQTGQMLPDEDYFEQPRHSSDRWNFHGYERTITMLAPSQPGGGPSLTVEMKMGSGQGMSFGGDEQLFNPATPAALKTQWEALASGHRAPDK